MSHVVDFFHERYGIAPECVAVAPGRLEFIGNHNDYNGGPVMGVAVDRVISVALARTDGNEAELATLGNNDTVVAPLDAFTAVQGPDSWVNYPLGVYHVLKGAGMQARGGLKLAVASTLPPGAGMSSSAAIELASGYAFAALYGFQAERKEMARYGRMAENDYVGVPCGILDQGVCAFGKQDHIVRIDCKLEEFDRVPLPHDVHFWVFNTQKKHALIDSLYAERHRECTEAFEILATANPGLECLADAELGMLADAETKLGDARTARARHIITETMRVREMSSALREGDLQRMGNLLLASHSSSRYDFENSCDELDALVDGLKALPGVYGCRLTGGGFGGAVMAVTDGSFSKAIARGVCASYAKAYGHKPTIFHTQTGDGAHVVS